ncbi:MAG TPA: tetratricopeptide repeat protein [Pyrinomonadaceae bacterium]
MQSGRSWRVYAMLLALTLGGAWWVAVGRVSAQTDDLEEAKRLNREVVRLHGAGRYDEAVPLAERALAIREKALGAEHPAVAQSLNSLAILYEAKGDYARAEPLYERTLALREKLLGAEHADVATSLNNLAGLNYLKGDYARAEPLYQRALAIREKLLGVEHPGIAAPLNNLALLYHVKGDYKRAEPLYQRALSIREKNLGAEHPDLALSISNLAGLYDSTGDYVRAEPLYKRALAIFEKALGAEHPEVATSLDNIAGIYRTKGDYASAEPLYQRALAIYEKVLGTEHPSVADSLNNIAALHYERGDYGRAELLHQRALAIREKTLGATHPAVASSLGNLALLYEVKGDYGRAEPLYLRAIAIREKALGGEHPEVALTLNNLALLYQARGDYARAEPLYRRALAIREKVLGTQHPDVAISFNSLAVMYHVKGDYASAEPLYQRALAISEKALGAEHPEHAQALNNLAGMYHDSGDYVRSEPLHQRTLAIREKVFGAAHPAVASSLNNLSDLYEAKGDYERAIAGRSRSADIREQNITLILTTGSEKQKQLYLDTLSGETDTVVSLNIKGAPKNDAATRLALNTILRRKGRALDAMTDQIAALRRRAGTEDQKLLDQLAAARSQLANLQLGGASSNLTPAARQAQLVALAEEIEKLEANIGRRSAEFRVQAQPVTLSNVQAALPAGAALIEIFSYRPYNTKAQPGNKFGAARYVAYVSRREGEPQFVELGEAAAIEANVEKLRRTLRDSRQAARGDVSAVKEAARVVDEQVMRPVRGLLGATRRIFLSPDGALNLIPFAALVDERGKYLVEDYTLTYLTSGRDLLRLQASDESKSPPLVLANPLYNDSGGNTGSQVETLSAVAAKRDVDFNAIDFSKVSYVPLPGTADEAKALSALMPGARLLSAAEATEAALKQVHAPRILHVATHGFFLTDKPRQADSRGVGLSSTTPAVASRGENLLLRSGLILAGVNQRRSGTDEDGVLTAAEAAALDLWGTKLVVLSACETGLGDVKNGDGVYGLRRALVLAGSESQVMSLWQVSDAATRDLMKAYYARLQSGEGRTEALRQVQLEMLKGTAAVQGGQQERTLLGSSGAKAQASNYHHPFYWASFIQSGAWSGIESGTTAGGCQ